ncbi:hypothetical protein STEG23_025886 [Scotinomys teguina]
MKSAKAAALKPSCRGLWLFRTALDSFQKRRAACPCTKPSDIADLLDELIKSGQLLGVKFIAELGVSLSQVKSILAQDGTDYEMKNTIVADSDDNDDDVIFCCEILPEKENLPIMLLPGMKVSLLLVQKIVNRTMELQESIGKGHLGIIMPGQCLIVSLKKTSIPHEVMEQYSFCHMCKCIPLESAEDKEHIVTSSSESASMQNQSFTLRRNNFCPKVILYPSVVFEAFED